MFFSRLECAWRALIEKKSHQTVVGDNTPNLLVDFGKRLMITFFPLMSQSPEFLVCVASESLHVTTEETRPWQCTSVRSSQSSPVAGAISRIGRNAKAVSLCVCVALHVCFWLRLRCLVVYSIVVFNWKLTMQYNRITYTCAYSLP